MAHQPSPPQTPQEKAKAAASSSRALTRTSGQGSSPMQRAQQGVEIMTKAQQEAMAPFQRVRDAPNIAQQIEDAAGRLLDPRRLLNLGYLMIYKTPALQKCTPASMIQVLLDCAQLALEPIGVLGHVYIVPYKDQMQLQLGYKGMGVLALRTRRWAFFNGAAVYEADEFDYEEGSKPFLRHRVDLRAKERGEVIGAWAKGVPMAGVSAEPLTKVVTLAEIHEARSRSKDWAYWDRLPEARKKDARTPIWEEHFAAMAIKTAFRRLSPWLGMDVNLQAAFSLDEARDAGYDKGEAFADVMRGRIGEGPRHPQLAPHGAPETPRPGGLHEFSEAIDVSVDESPAPSDKPAPRAVQELVGRYQEGPGVGTEQLEKRVGKPMEEWGGGEVAELEVLLSELLALTPVEMSARIATDLPRK